MKHKWVVKISIEGWMCQAWICQEGNGRWASTSSLDYAHVFDSVAEAHKAMGEHGFPKWILGYEVVFKGLCTPNP